MNSAIYIHIYIYNTVGITEREYYYNRATSSVPAALISRVPLVAHTEFLQLYPCLREAKMHQYMARNTECESIEIALSLNNAQYQIAKNEIMNCTNFLWQQGLNTFENIIETNKNWRKKITR